jgi:uncharacterized protein YbcV (DUF1398 family)
MEISFIQTAEKCLRGAEGHTMTFPQIVGTLMQAGFESYCVDYRRAKAIYYRPDGDSVELGTDRLDAPVAEAFDTPAIQAAIREAQQLVQGYTYKSFCRKVMEAGCARVRGLHRLVQRASCRLFRPYGGDAHRVFPAIA